jgi:fatty-acyl-CoA synthase
VVVPKPGCVPDESALREHLAAAFASWWIPDAFVFADAIPRTTTGKMLKSALKERYAEMYASPREVATT